MSSPKLKVAVFSAVALAVSGVAAYAAGPSKASVSAPALATTTSAFTFSPATVVSQVAGVPDGSSTLRPNNTSAMADLNAADLGVMWDNGSGTIDIAFGDNYGAGWKAPVTCGPVCVPSTYTSDYRPNALAKSTDNNLSDGLTINSIVKDSTGHRKAVLPRFSGEVGTIPTSAVHIGTTDYITYMAVGSWGSSAGVWTTNGAAIASSTDGGQTWTRQFSAVWNNNGGDTRFQQAALADYNGYVYMYGTPNGRFGSAYVARVPEGSILSKAAYQYWNGSSWVVNNSSAAVPIVSAPVGELSVKYNAQLHVWVMTYLDQNAGAIVARTAPSPQGPWSSERTLVADASWTTYGAFIHPWSSGTTLYFVVSKWGPYQTYLMKTTITPPVAPAPSPSPTPVPCTVL